MRRGLVLFAVIVGCMPGVEFAGLQPGPRQAVFKDHVISTRLDNGLRVALLPDPRTNLVSVTVRYEVGGGDDPAGDEGLAHYVEHLLYLTSLRGREDAVLGGNAETRVDRTYFYTLALDTQLDASLEAAARRFELGCDALDATELARERDVVIEEHKDRTRGRWDSNGLERAIWGDRHLYARDIGGAAFADVSREKLCEFIDQHYGPGAATLVVTGNVDDHVLERIRTRFGSIPARAIAPRAQVSAIETGSVRIAVPGLQYPTAMLVIRVPGEGNRLDAALRMLDGAQWRLPHHVGDDMTKQSWAAETDVLGGERARIVIAHLTVSDPAALGDAVSALRQRFVRPELYAFGDRKLRERRRFADTFDDLIHAGIRIADLIARGQPPNRYNELRDIDDVRPEDVTALLAAPAVRVVELVPTADAAGLHQVADLATELHHLDVPRAPATTDLTPPPAPGRRVAQQVVEDRLGNGLTVWLAPDPSAFAIDARVVMPVDPGTGDAYDVAAGAAEYLHAPDGDYSHTKDDEPLRWYRSIATPVRARIGDRATTLGISAFALFGDWHVWQLARTIIDGTYSSGMQVRVDSVSGNAPSAIAVLARRLAGQRTPDRVIIHSTDELEHFRRTHYDPAHATLIVTGKFELEPMRREIRTLFSRWRPLAARAPVPANESNVLPGFVAIPALHAGTVDLAVAFVPTPGARSRDVTRTILTQMIQNRMSNLRESLGVTYGIQVAALRGVVVAGSVEPAYAGDAARALTTAIAGIRDGDDAFAADFVRARKEILARALAEPDSATARADELERAVEAGRGLGELDSEVEAIRTVDINAVRQLAALELEPARMITIVRGDPDAVRTTLAAFGATAFDTVSH